MVFLLNGFYAPSIPKLKWDAKKHRYVHADHGHGGGEGHGGGGDHAYPELAHGAHGAEEEHEEHEHDPLGDGGWMFLFIDLVLVALTSKCALVMEYCTLSPRSFIFSATVFTVMFLTRQHLDEYCNRFYANDMFHRLCYFLYVGSFFTMALNVNTVENHSHMDWKCKVNISCQLGLPCTIPTNCPLTLTRHSPLPLPIPLPLPQPKANLYGCGFGVGYCLSRSIVALLYASVMYDEPNKAFEQFCGPLCCRIITITFVAICVFCESMANSEGKKGLFPPALRIYIYLIATLIEWAYDLFHNVVLGLKKGGVDVPNVIVCLEYYPLELMEYQERLGAFIMLVLGESMICLLLPYFNMNYASQTYIFHTMSYVIIFCFGIMYYDGANHPETQQEHAVNHSLTSAFIYFWIHVLVGLSVFYTSCSMGILYLAEVASDGVLHDDKTPDPTPSDDRTFPNLANPAKPIYDPMDVKICTPVQLLAASVAMAIVFMGIMRATHRGLETYWNCEPDAELARARWSLAWRIGCGIFHFTVPSYGLKHPSANAGIHLALLVLMLLLEVRYKTDEDKHGVHGGRGGEHDTYGHHNQHTDRKSDGGNPMHGFHGGIGGPHARGHGNKSSHRMDARSAAAIVHKDKRTVEMLGVPPRIGSRDHPLDPRRSYDMESRRSFGSQGRRSSGQINVESGHGHGGRDHDDIGSLQGSVQGSQQGSPSPRNSLRAEIERRRSLGGGEGRRSIGGGQ